MATSMAVKERLTVEAPRIGEFQACRRRFLLNTDWRVIKWRPKALFDACLRQAIFTLARAKDADLEMAVATATSRFLETAANPGLDIPYGSNPYVIAKDWTAMLSTILPSIVRRGLTALADTPEVKLSERVGWKPKSWLGGDGRLHRWITVDHWGQADLSRELHSWWTLGDVAATRTAMVIHVVEIGQTRNGRRQSPWARAWKHPAMPNLRLRFRRVDGSEFRGYAPFYLADQSRVDAVAWVDQMWQEKAAEPLMHDVQADVPGDVACDIVTRDILAEAAAMRDLLTDRGTSPFHVLPMSRGACDGFVPCPWQSVCYATQVADPSSLGLYQRRSAG